MRHKEMKTISSITDDCRFSVTEDHLARKPIALLIIENTYYKISLFYYGNYTKEKESFTLDKKWLSVACDPRGDYLPIKHQNNYAFIDITNENQIDIWQTDKFTDKINIARRSAIELMNVIHKYFDNI